MGAVKRTHPKARQQQMQEKFARKYPKEYRSLIKDISEVICKALKPALDAFIKTLSQFFDALAQYINQTQSESTDVSGEESRLPEVEDGK